MAQEPRPVAPEQSLEEILGPAKPTKELSVREYNEIDKILRPSPTGPLTPQERTAADYSPTMRELMGPIPSGQDPVLRQPKEPPPIGQWGQYAEQLGRESLTNITKATENFNAGIYNALIVNFQAVDDMARRNVFGMDLGLERAAKTVLGPEPAQFKRFLPSTQKPELLEATAAVEKFAPALEVVRNFKDIAEEVAGFFAGPSGQAVSKVGGAVTQGLKALLPRAGIALKSLMEMVGMGSGFAAERAITTGGDPQETTMAGLAGAGMRTYGFLSNLLSQKMLLKGIPAAVAAGASKALEGVGVTPVFDTDMLPRVVRNIAEQAQLARDLQEAMARGDTAAADKLNARSKEIVKDYVGMLTHVAANAFVFGAPATLGGMRSTRSTAPKEFAKRAVEAAGRPEVPQAFIETMDRQGFHVERGETGVRLRRPGLDAEVSMGEKGLTLKVEGKEFTGEEAVRYLAGLHDFSRLQNLKALELESYEGIERTATPGVYYAKLPGFEGHLALRPDGELMGRPVRQGEKVDPTEGWEPLSQDIFDATVPRQAVPLSPQEGGVLNAWAWGMQQAPPEAQAVWEPIAAWAQRATPEQRMPLMQALADPKTIEAAKRAPEETLGTLADALIADRMGEAPKLLEAATAPPAEPAKPEAEKPGEAQPTQQQEAAQPAVRVEGQAPEAPGKPVQQELPLEQQAAPPAPEAVPEGTKPPSLGAEGEAVAGAMFGTVAAKVGKAGWRATKAIGRGLREIAEFHSEPMIERLERVGEGKPKVQAAAQQFRKVTDTAQKFAGELSTDVNPALLALGRANASTAWLNAIVENPSGRSGIRRMRLALEGKIEVPKEHQATFEAGQKGNLAIGKMPERVVKGYKASGLMQRMMTADQVDAIQQPSGSVGRRALVEAYMESNPGVARKTVEDIFDSMKSHMDGGDWQAVERMMNQEFKRAFPQVPSVMKDANGVWRDLFHDRAYDYISTAATRTALRTAVLTHFPKKTIAELARSIHEELPSGQTSAVDDVVRALHGMPRDLGKRDPFRRSGDVGFLLGHVLSDVVSPLYLFASAVPNAPEVFMGNVARNMGYGPFVQGLWKLYGPGGRTFRGFLEHMRATNQAVYDWSSDPAHPVLTFMRRFRNAGSFATARQFLNELQERTAPATAYVLADAMSKGKLAKVRQRDMAGLLKDMGFTQAQARSMVTGQAPADLYMQYVRMAAGTHTGGNKLMVEQSRLLNSRILSKAFPWQPWPVMQARQLIRPLGRYFKAVKAGDNAEASVAMRQVVKQLGFTVASGAVVRMLQDALSGGILAGNTSGLSIFEAETKARMEEEPLSLLADLFLYGFGGPYSMVWDAFKRQADEEGQLGQMLFDMSVPGQIATDLYKLAPTLAGQNGKGAFANRDPLEAWGMFLKRNAAGRIISTYGATLGFGGMSAGEKMAVRKFWQWREKQPEPITAGRGGSMEHAKFIDAMRDAATKIKAGENPSEDLQRAFGLTGDDVSRGKAIQKIQSSLRSRRLIEEHAKTPEQQANLKKWVGERAYKALEHHDDLLDQAARRIRSYLK